MKCGRHGWFQGEWFFRLKRKGRGRGRNNRRRGLGLVILLLLAFGGYQQSWVAGVQIRPPSCIPEDRHGEASEG